MMATGLELLSDGIFVMEWYSWAGLIGIVVVLIAYKLYQKKMMDG